MLKTNIKVLVRLILMSGLITTAITSLITVVSSCPVISKAEDRVEEQRAKFYACLVSPGCNLSKYSGMNTPNKVHSNRKKHLVNPVSTVNKQTTTKPNAQQIKEHLQNKNG